MANTFTMIEETETRIIRSIRWIKRTIRRSWTIRTLKHEYGVIVITLLGVALALGCLYTFVKAEQWILNEKVVTVSPWNYVRGIKTAKAEELTTEQYIRLVFGKDAPTALLVAKAESGMRCDAQNVNKGTNSLDAGLFQINSVHLKKAGWKIGDLLDCHRNTDMAYKIFKGSGWGAWSVCTKKVKC